MIQELSYKQDSAGLFECLSAHRWPVFLDSGYPRTDQGRYDIVAADPVTMLVTRGAVTEIRRSEEVLSSEEDPFALLRRELGEHRPLESAELPFYGGAIGYFGYDLGRRIEQLPELAHDAENIPDMMVGIYEWAVVTDHLDKRTWLVSQGGSGDGNTGDRVAEILSRPAPGDETRTPFRVCSPVRSNMTREQYAGFFRRIKRYLQEGDCYQVNLAQRFVAKCEGDAWLAYRVLREINPAPFAGYLDFDPVQVLSSSPERFLKIRDRKVETKPIKGTLPRVVEAAADRKQVERLQNSSKDRAENLMIVDLLRNDIGKNCTPGSVSVPRLFDVESFATVHHLVSTVCGELAPDMHSLDLLRGCFPGGSITGAPKIRAMEIIEELEPHRRGVYCGSIGYIGFDGTMDTNIAIRTLVRSDNQIRFWAGGGIVADSNEDAEYQESFDKAAAMLKLLDLMQGSTGQAD